MPHKIEISDKTFERLKDFCALNGLKLGQCADKLIYDGLMIEMYGDVPFTNYRKPIEGMEAAQKQMEEIAVRMKPEELEEVRDDVDKLFTEPKKDFTERYEKIAQSDWFKEAYVGKSLGDDGPEVSEEPEINPEKTEETLREIGVPTKVVNKITRRRLK